MSNNITNVNFDTDDSQSSIKFSKLRISGKLQRIKVVSSYIVFQSIYNKQSVTIHYYCVRLYTTTPFTLQKNKTFNVYIVRNKCNLVQHNDYGANSLQDCPIPYVDT